MQTVGKTDCETEAVKRLVCEGSAAKPPNTGHHWGHCSHSPGPISQKQFLDAPLASWLSSEAMLNSEKAKAHLIVPDVGCSQRFNFELDVSFQLDAFVAVCRQLEQSLTVHYETYHTSVPWH